MPTAPIPTRLWDAGHPQAAVCAACEVRRLALFRTLEPASLERIHTHIASPHAETDQRLYGRGDPDRALYTVRSGVVRLERVSENGARRILRLAGPGDLLGQEALLGQPHADDAIACTPVEYCRIPVPLVQELGASDAGLMHELMQRWQQALDASARWQVELATGSARYRLLKLLGLLQQYADAEGLIWLPRREEIGDMLNMVVETASRQISRLRRDGVLELQPPRGAVVDGVALAQALRHACDD